MKFSTKLTKANKRDLIVIAVCLGIIFFFDWLSRSPPWS
jgi:hypothetical protein